MDLPGHGDSDAIKWDCSIEHGVTLLAHALPQTCSIVGWSLGGLMAQLLIKQFPQRIVNAMLIASTPKFVAGGTWAHGMNKKDLLDFSRQYTRNPQQTMRKFCALQVVSCAHAKRTYAALIHALSDQARHIGKIQWGLQWLQNVDLRDDAVLMSRPLCLLQGRNDQVSCIFAAEQMLGIWKHTRLTCIENAGHVPFVSHPQHFLEWVDDNMKQHA